MTAILQKEGYIQLDIIFLQEPLLRYFAIQRYIYPPRERYEDALRMLKRTGTMLRNKPKFPIQELPDTAMVLVLSFLGDEVNSCRVSKNMDARVTRALKSNRYWLSRLELDKGCILIESDFAYYDARKLYKCVRSNTNHGPDTPDSWLIYMYRTSPDFIDMVATIAIGEGRLDVLQFLAKECYDFSEYIESSSFFTTDDVRSVQFLVDHGVEETKLLELVIDCRKKFQCSVDAAKLLIDRLARYDSKRENIALMLAMNKRSSTALLCGDPVELIEHLGLTEVDSVLYDLQYYGEPLALKALLDYCSSKSITVQARFNIAVLKRGYAEILSMLLDMGLNIGAGNDPLRWKHLSIVQAFHARGLITNEIVGKIYESALQFNNLDIIGFMIDNNYYSASCIILSIEYDRLEAMSLMLRQHVGDETTINPALWFALENGRSRHVKALIEAGGNVELITLDQSIKRDDLRMLEVLLDYVEPSLSHLEISISICKPSVTELVLKHGKWTNEQLYVFISYATMSLRFNHISVLFNAKTCVDKRDSRELLFAAAAGHVGMVRKMLSQFCFDKKILTIALTMCVKDIKSVSSGKDTFVEHDIIDIIELLLESILQQAG